MNVNSLKVRELLDLKRWSIVCFASAVVACFAVSPMALGFFGITYDSAGGAAWQKLHPATYLIALAITLGLLGRDNRVAYLRKVLAKLPGVAFFVAIWILLTVYAALVRHSPITSLLETFLIAVTALVMYDELPQRVQSGLRLFLHVFLSVNALVGLGEHLTHMRVFPYVIGGEEVTGDHRSTALMGHPLQNAATSAAYLLCLFLGGDAALAPMTRLALILVQIIGLACFGGRTAIVASALIIGANLLKDFVFVLLGARFDMRRVLALTIGAPLVLAAVFYVALAGTFDDTAARFIEDNGSAEARVIMWRLFDSFALPDLLIGPDPEAVNTRLVDLGIGIGIENTWISLIFQYGVLMTLFFVAGLLALFWEFWRRSREGAFQLFLFFLALISSAIGLAAKTMIFNHFALLLLLVFSERQEEAAPARRGASAAGAPFRSLPRADSGRRRANWRSC
ncbi:MAG TPA: VpsF family polysaccharide biosynthesis protein [Methylocystis sp.]|nr:VpsF family polysaccharide biosynthesis protein [Methylocystis sp.]